MMVVVTHSMAQARRAIVGHSPRADNALPATRPQFRAWIARLRWSDSRRRRRREGGMGRAIDWITGSGTPTESAHAAIGRASGGPVGRIRRAARNLSRSRERTPPPAQRRSDADAVGPPGPIPHLPALHMRFAMNRPLFLLGVSAAMMSATVLAAPAMAQNSVFTYQGELKASGDPVNDLVDFRFTLWTAAVGGTQIGASDAHFDILLVDGRFTVDLDFGANAFDGSARFLQIEVRRPAGSGSFQLLSPRQAVTATPYALKSLGNTLAWTDFSGEVRTSSEVGVGDFGNEQSQALLHVREGDANLPTGFLYGDEVVVEDGVGDAILGLYARTGDKAGITFGDVFAGSDGAKWGVYKGSSNLYFNWGLDDAIDNGTTVMRLSGSSNDPGIFLDGDVRILSDRMFVNEDFVGFGRVTALTATEYFGISNPATGTNLGGMYMNTAATTARPYYGWATGGTSRAYAYYDGTANQLRFNVGGDRITIDRTSGAVGIGTTSPTSRLTVSGNMEASGIIQAGGELRALANAAVTGTLNVSSTSRLLGNVGVGTSSPSVRLHADGGTDASLGGGGFFIMGATAGGNMVMDTNEIMARNAGGAATLYLNHEGGDVQIGQGSGGTTRLITPILQITGGSDLSEGFEIAHDDITPQPGMVVVIDPANPGRLMPATSAYDKKVAGIISGAGGVNTGLVMGQSDSIADGRHPVALTGRVYCFVDAGEHAIEPGDLLTTSDTPGHAMKATDWSRAHGAVIGKAMTSLAQGEKGLVLVLVNLQ
jgi:hypothetical protein